MGRDYWFRIGCISLHASRQISSEYFFFLNGSIIIENTEKRWACLETFFWLILQIHTLIQNVIYCCQNATKQDYVFPRSGGSLQAEVCRSFIAMTVRDQSPSELTGFSPRIDRVFPSSISNRYLKG